MEERFAAASARLKGGDKVDVVQIRCDEHRDGKRPMLAKVYIVREGLLFTSRIKWLPSDQLTLRPWRRDALLLTIGDDSDERLASTIGHLDEWAAGKPPDGHRWLKGMRDLYVRDVLDLPPHDGWVPELWTRCSDHPGKAKRQDRDELVAAARAAAPPRRSPSSHVALRSDE